MRRCTRSAAIPSDDGFVEALCDLLENGFRSAKPGLSYRVLFSAHGLPKRIVDRGDPYQWQVERTVQAVLERWRGAPFEHTICYQSRVGPLEWIRPATDAEIRRAGADGKALIVVPVAFVSEHSETLVELDIEYGKLARASGVPDYIRVPTVRAHPKFIDGLAGLVNAALASPRARQLRRRAHLSCRTAMRPRKDLTACLMSSARIISGSRPSTSSR